MEVHHHSHHPKKWKEYITEFLMLFLAVSMGFVAENLREKHIENERAEELIHAFIIDIKENQRQVDSLIVNNQRLSAYFDSLIINHSITPKPANLYDLAGTLDFWMYRFTNRKTIFEQMKSSGALRYIQDKEILTAILRYEEHANLAESRSMEIETQQYFDHFRPDLAKIVPPTFFIYRSTVKNIYSKRIAIERPEIHPTFKAQFMANEKEIINSLKNTKITLDQTRELSKIWHHREERLELSLNSQIAIREEGEQLLKLLEKDHH
ncbi:MAG: hypothetical protein RL387_1606 [Bacteroidota bacterium]|jgi:hypothetical protein